MKCQALLLPFEMNHKSQVPATIQPQGNSFGSFSSGTGFSSSSSFSSAEGSYEGGVKINVFFRIRINAGVSVTARTG